MAPTPLTHSQKRKKKGERVSKISLLKNGTFMIVDILNSMRHWVLLLTVQYAFLLL